MISFEEHVLLKKCPSYFHRRFLSVSESTSNSRFLCLLHSLFFFSPSLLIPLSHRLFHINLYSISYYHITSYPILYLFIPIMSCLTSICILTFSSPLLYLLPVTFSHPSSYPVFYPRLNGNDNPDTFSLNSLNSTATNNSNNNSSSSSSNSNNSSSSSSSSMYPVSIDYLRDHSILDLLTLALIHPTKQLPSPQHGRTAKILAFACGSHFDENPETGKDLHFTSII